jgi:hypothetical protein
VDDENPAITCPADVTVNCEEDRSSANTGAAKATDNCDREIDIIESDSVAGGSCPQEEVITRTWTGTDDCGNASSCEQIVAVVDDESPAITCPADVTVNCEEDRSSANTGAAKATDNCDREIDIIEIDSVAGGSCPQEEVITRTWTGTDDCGNASSCEQIVAVVDDENPAITCPADVTVNCEEDRSSAATGVATATDNCDDDVTITEIDSVAAGSCPQEEVITRTWTGTDDCGNASSCEQIVAVVDDENPAISCPPDVTLNCQDNASSYNTGVAKATDNCDKTGDGHQHPWWSWWHHHGDKGVEINESDSVAAGSCPQEAVIERTWTGTDDCGNTASCTQVITIVDDEAPMMTCPADVTVNCEDDSSSASTGAATATDNCDKGDHGYVHPRWRWWKHHGDDDHHGHNWSHHDDDDDDWGHHDDDEDGHNWSHHDGDDDGHHWSHHGWGQHGYEYGVDIIESDSVADGSCAQEEVIKRTWTGTDDCGNASSCTQIVTIVDDEAPEITCPGDVTVNCEDDRSSASTGVATATDNCAGEIDITEIDSVAAGSCPQEEVITRTWTGTDDCGNVSSCDQLVTVVDDEAPTVTCPADATVECEDDRSSANTGAATATDTCDGEIDITESDSVADGSCAQEEVITRTWTGTDDCGNASSCDQVVTVVDTTPPEVQCNGYDITEFDGDDDDDDDDDDDSVSFTATATDLCSDVRIKVGWIVCLPPPGDDDDDDDCKVRAVGATITIIESGAPGTVIGWTAKAADDCGNITAVSCSVTVLEAEEEEEEEEEEWHPWWWHWRHW